MKQIKLYKTTMFGKEALTPFKIKDAEEVVRTFPEKGMILKKGKKTAPYVDGDATGWKEVAQ